MYQPFVFNHVHFLAEGIIEFAISYGHRAKAGMNDNTGRKMPGVRTNFKDRDALTSIQKV